MRSRDNRSCGILRKRGVEINQRKNDDQSKKLTGLQGINWDDRKRTATSKDSKRKNKIPGKD